MLSPHCTECPRQYWCYPPHVLMLSPMYWIPSTILKLSPIVLMLPPFVLNNLHSTEGIPHMYCCYPTVLKASLHSTEYPPQYWCYPPQCWCYPLHVLMLSPHCTSQPPQYWRYPHSTEAIPHCTERPPQYWSYPPMYWTTSYVLTLYNVCSVHRGMFSTSGDMNEGGIPWVHRGDLQCIGRIPWVHRGDIMSTLGDFQYIGGISWYMWGSNLIKSFQFLLKTPMYLTSPDVLMISPPMYSWYPPRCTHGSPPMYWTPPDVLNIPRCTEHTLYRVVLNNLHSTEPTLYGVSNATKVFNSILYDFRI